MVDKLGNIFVIVLINTESLEFVLQSVNNYLGIDLDLLYHEIKGK